MFILRSAFWLTVGFMIMAPHGTDLGATAGKLTDEAVTKAVSAGEDIVGQILTKKYASTSLIDVSAAIPTSADLPLQHSPATLVVFPRSRPAAMG
jgi:hypothetical protein